jgi:hypothetical protein
MGEYDEDFEAWLDQLEQDERQREEQDHECVER